MKSVIGGGAAIASALLASALIFSAQPSVARTFRSRLQQHKQETVQPAATQPTVVAEPSVIQPGAQKTISATMTSAVAAAAIEPVTEPVNYIATAYSLPGHTASGLHVRSGLIAADPSVLPLGTRVRVDAGQYSGEYLVADTGTAVLGKRIDIWIPTLAGAKHFGRRTVKLTVLSYGPRRSRAKLHHR